MAVIAVRGRDLLCFAALLCCSAALLCSDSALLLCSALASHEPRSLAAELRVICGFSRCFVEWAEGPKPGSGATVPYPPGYVAVWFTVVASSFHNKLLSTSQGNSWSCFSYSYSCGGAFFLRLTTD